MAKIKLLSARSVNSLPEGFHSDGGNLFLRVRGDSRNWIFRYKKQGKQIVIGLGATHSRSLQEARELAERMRNAILNKKDPRHVLMTKSEYAMTFNECVFLLMLANRI